MWYYRAGFRCGHVIRYKSHTKNGRNRFQEYARNNICPVCKIINKGKSLSPKEQKILQKIKPRIVALVG